MRRVLCLVVLAVSFMTGMAFAVPQDDQIAVFEIADPRNASGLSASGTMTVCARASIYTVELGLIPMSYQSSTSGNTPRGDGVGSGYFYVSNPGISWGTIYNPEGFYKVWFDVSGRIDQNFFHVSVPTGQFCTNYYCGSGCASWWDCENVPMNTYARSQYWRSYCP